MGKLLDIKATPRDEESRSMKLAGAFLEAYQEAHPDDSIETLDVFEADIPEFDAVAVAGKYDVLHGVAHEGAEVARWQQVVETAEHFKSFDKYVITTPMWNFGIPYRLKLYLDTIIQPGLTFGFDPERGLYGLVGDKPVMILATRGSVYTEANGWAAYDFQVPYLKATLAVWMGLTDVKSIVAEPTDMGEPVEQAQALQAAVQQAREAGASF